MECGHLKSLKLNNKNLNNLLSKTEFNNNNKKFLKNYNNYIKILVKTKMNLIYKIHLIIIKIMLFIAKKIIYNNKNLNFIRIINTLIVLLKIPIIMNLINNRIYNNGRNFKTKSINLFLYIYINI